MNWTTSGNSDAAVLPPLSKITRDHIVPSRPSNSPSRPVCDRKNPDTPTPGQIDGNAPLTDQRASSENKTLRNFEPGYLFLVRIE